MNMATCQANIQKVLFPADCGQQIMWTCAVYLLCTALFFSGKDDKLTSHMFGKLTSHMFGPLSQWPQPCLNFSGPKAATNNGFSKPHVTPVHKVLKLNVRSIPKAHQFRVIMHRVHVGVTAQRHRIMLSGIIGRSAKNIGAHLYSSFGLVLWNYRMRLLSQQRFSEKC